MNDLQLADETFQRFLQSKGLRYTRERQLVLRAIMRLEGHFSLPRLLKRLSKKDHIHRATLYRMLPLLEEGQIIRRSHSGETGEWHYEHLIGHQHHDHLICIRCGKVIEFFSKKFESEQQRLCHKHGFQEMGHQFYIKGICPGCQKRRRRKR